MRLNSKKAAGMGFVIMMLLVVIGIFLYSPLHAATVRFIIGSGDTAACTISIIQGQGTAKCPVDEIKISKEKVEKNGNMLLKKGSRTEEEMAKEAMARLLTACLAKGGGLNSKAFERRDWFGSEVVCLECSHIIFEDKTGSVSGLNSYLINTKIPNSKDKFYINTLTKNNEHKDAYLKLGDSKNLILWPSENEISMDKATEYTIIFLGIKKSATGAFFTRLRELRFEAILMPSLFSREDTYYSYITKTNDIGKICEIKIN